MFAKAADMSNSKHGHQQIDAKQENKTLEKRDRSRSPLRDNDVPAFISVPASPCKSFDAIEKESNPPSVISTDCEIADSYGDGTNFSVSSVSSYQDSEMDLSLKSKQQTGNENGTSSSTLEDSGFAGNSFENDVNDDDIPIIQIPAFDTVQATTSQTITQSEAAPAVLNDVNWLNECAVVTTYILQGLSVREALAQSGVCATELIMDTLRAHPYGFHLRKPDNWFSKNQLNTSGLRRIMPRLGLHDASSQNYKKVFNSLQRFSGTYIFLKHALDHGNFPEALQPLQHKATELRHFDANHNPEKTRCQNIRGKIVLAWSEEGMNFQSPRENQENRGPENDIPNSNAPQEFSNGPLRDANQNNAILRLSAPSASFQPVEYQVQSCHAVQKICDNETENLAH